MSSTAPNIADELLFSREAIGHTRIIFTGWHKTVRGPYPRRSRPSSFSLVGVHHGYLLAVVFPAAGVPKPPTGTQQAALLRFTGQHPP